MLLFPAFALTLLLGIDMDNEVGITELVDRATTIAVVKPLRPDGSHDLKTLLFTSSPRPVGKRLLIELNSTYNLSQLPNQGEGKQLLYDEPKEPSLRCDRTRSECIAFLFDGDEWGRHVFVSDVETVPLSRRKEVEKAWQAKVRRSGGSIHFTELPLEKFVRMPSHILVVDPLSPERVKRSVAAGTPEGETYEFPVDRFSVVQTIRAQGVRPVPATIEVRAFDQHAQERWAIFREGLTFHAPILAQPRAKPTTGRRIVFLWEHPDPGQYVYIAEQASLPMNTLDGIRNLSRMSGN